MISFVCLLLVFLFIALRSVLPFRLGIWVYMSLGALVVIIFNEISLKEAFFAIDYDVMIFLASMFVVAEAFEKSGLLEKVSNYLFQKGDQAYKLFAYIIFGLGGLSALFMNDTIALMGTPLLIHLTKKRKEYTKPLLLALAYAITMGSVMSPVGNPQNLLIATTSIQNPFWVFLRYLFFPTFLSLAVLYLFFVIKFRFISLPQNEVYVKKSSFQPLVLWAFAIFLCLIVLNLLLRGSFPLFLVALIPALFLLVFSRKNLLRGIDWRTLLFFVSMFILMKSVWNQTHLESILKQIPHLFTVFGMLSSGVLVSQLISNVPFVYLLLPLMPDSDAVLMALAAGSTLAGSLLILGAASNIIIIQNAENRSVTPFTFFEFFKWGLPLTLVSFFIYWIFLT